MLTLKSHRSIILSFALLMIVNLCSSFQMEESENVIISFLKEIKENKKNNSLIIDEYFSLKSADDMQSKASKEVLSQIIEEYRVVTKNVDIEKIHIKKYSEIKESMNLKMGIVEREGYRAIVYNNKIIGRCIISKKGKLQSISTLNKGDLSFFLYL